MNISTIPWSAIVDRLNAEGLGKLILQVGGTTAIALFLVWFVTSRMDVRLDATLKAAQENHSMLIEAQRSMAGFAQEQIRHNERIQTQLRQICLNGLNVKTATAVSIAACQ